MSKKEFNDKGKKSFGQIKNSNNLENEINFGDKSYVSTSKNLVNSEAAKKVLSPKIIKVEKTDSKATFGISLKRRLEIITENRQKIIDFNEEQRKLEEYYYQEEKEKNYNYDISEEYSKSDYPELEEDKNSNNSSTSKTYHSNNREKPERKKYYSQSGGRDENTNKYFDGSKKYLGDKSYFNSSTRSEDNKEFNQNNGFGKDSNNEKNSNKTTNKNYSFGNKSYVNAESGKSFISNTILEASKLTEKEKDKYRRKYIKIKNKTYDNNSTIQGTINEITLGSKLLSHKDVPITAQIRFSDKTYKKLYNHIDKLNMNDPYAYRAGRLVNRFIDEHSTYYGDRFSIQKESNQKFINILNTSYKIARNRKNIKKVVSSGLIAFNLFKSTGDIKDLFINNQLAYSTKRTILKMPNNAYDYLLDKTNNNFNEYRSDDLSSDAKDKVDNLYRQQRARFRQRNVRKRKKLEVKKNVLSHQKLKNDKKIFINEKMSKENSPIGLTFTERARNKRKLKKKYAKEFTKNYKKQFKGLKWTQKFARRFKAGKEALQRISYFFKTKVVLISVIIVVCLMLLGSCVSCLGGCTGGITGVYSGGWQTENESDATKVEEWYKNAEKEFYESLAGIEEDYPDYDEYLYDIEPAHHDYIALCSYLTAKMDKWSYESAIEYLEELFNSQYEIKLTESKRTDIVPKRDGASGKIKNEPVEVKVLKIKVTNHGLNNCKDFYKDMLEADKHDWYGDMYQLIGNYASITPPSENWEDTITRGFGMSLADSSYEDYITLGAFKGKVNAPFYGQVIGKGDNSITVRDDSTKIELEYMNIFSSLPIGGRIQSGSELGQAIRLKVRMTTPRGNVLNPAYYFQRNGLDETTGSYEETGDVTTWNPDSKEMTELDIPIEGEAMKKIMKLYQKYKGSCYYLGAEGEIRGRLKIIGDRGKKAYYYYSDYWFDCSGLVWRLFNESGVKKFGRGTASSYYRNCNVFRSMDMAKPGDLVFFRNTTGNPGVTHVGIYIGNGKFIHSSAYNPSKPFSSETGISDVYGAYWKDHYPEFGRLP